MKKRAQAALEQPPAAARHLHAQAALEFLMTYGWAILIMLVVIAVLFFLGVFNSSTSVPSSCVLPAGFTCKEFSLDSSGRLYLDLGQATGKTVTVNGVGCGPVGGSVSSLSIPISIQSGDHGVISDSDVACSGDYSGGFKGKISIRYQPAGASYNKTITGDLSAPVAVVAAGEQGQWNTSYGYYRQVTINTGVASNLANFPAYFIIDTQHLIAWGRMNSSCKDLRVVNSTKNGVMDYEIENNTCNTTSTVVWFRVPQTNAATDYTAYVFYGNNSAPDAQNKAGVWSNNYLAVWHMGDLQDSAGSNACTDNGTSSVNGRFGQARDFNGVNASINCGTGASLNILFPLTVSAWVNPTITGQHGVVYDCASPWAGYAIYLRMPSKPIGFSANNGTNSTHGTLTVTLSGWTRIAETFDNANIIPFVNDAEYSLSSSIGSEAGAFTGVILGYNGWVAAPKYLNGTMDEVRISNVTRSADWLAAEYGQTYSVGSEQVN